MAWITEEKLQTIEKWILFFRKNLIVILLALAIVALVYIWIAYQSEVKSNKDLETQLNSSKDQQIVQQRTINSQATQLLTLALQLNKQQSIELYNVLHAKDNNTITGYNDSDSEFKQYADSAYGFRK